MQTLQKWGGIAAILEGALYLIGFITFGAILQFPASGATSTEEIQFLIDQQLIMSIANFLIYVLFGILLAVLVLAVHHLLKESAPALSQMASIFGLIWVGLVIASGMIANIGLHRVVSIGSEMPEKAYQIWSSLNIVIEGLGGGNEIVGGMWVLLLSIAALKKENFPKVLVYLGILVGATGILTVLQMEIFNIAFGLSQIIWFIWLGIFLLRSQ